MTSAGNVTIKSSSQYFHHPKLGTGYSLIINPERWWKFFRTRKSNWGILRVPVPSNRAYIAWKSMYIASHLACMGEEIIFFLIVLIWRCWANVKFLPCCPLLESGPRTIICKTIHTLVGLTSSIVWHSCQSTYVSFFQYSRVHCLIGSVSCACPYIVIGSAILDHLLEAANLIAGQIRTTYSLFTITNESTSLPVESEKSTKQNTQKYWSYCRHRNFSMRRCLSCTMLPSRKHELKC